MRGFTYDDDNNLVVDHDCTLIVWALVDLTINSPGTIGGIAFSKNGLITGVRTSAASGITDVVGLIDVAAGDVIGLRVYSDDPANSFSVVRCIIAEAQTDLDNQVTWGEAVSFRNKGKFFMVPDYRPSIVPGNPSEDKVLRAVQSVNSSYTGQEEQIFVSWAKEDSILLGPLAFAFDAPSPLAGIFLTGVNPDRVLVAVYLIIDEAFDGTTPTGAIFIDGDTPYVIQDNINLSGATEVGVGFAAALKPAGSIIPVFADPDSEGFSVSIKITDGADGDSGATQGSGRVYLELRKPTDSET